MAIPSMESLMKEVIAFLAHRNVWERRSIILHIRQKLIEKGEVSEEEAYQKLDKSGQYSRISWAISHPFRAGILESFPSYRSRLTITSSRHQIEGRLESIIKEPREDLKRDLLEGYGEPHTTSKTRDEGVPTRKGASASVLITTSSFTEEAKKAYKAIGKNFFEEV